MSTTKKPKEGDMTDEPRWHHYGVNRDRGWRSGAHHLHGPNTHASVEWHLLDRGFGIGLEFGRNGMESDMGLDLHASRLGSVWLRLASPWTKWLKVRDRDKPHWHDPRHYGVMLFPYKGCWLRFRFGAYDGSGPKVRRWREPSLSAHTFLGLNSTQTSEGESGMTLVPMPEGNYPAQWTEVTHTTRYTKPLGKVRDAILGPRSSTHVKIDVPGGIPVEGKGENSWDCGMDGIFGTSGPTVPEAVANCTRAALRYRERYGGPHDLPHPMTVTEAGSR